MRITLAEQLTGWKLEETRGKPLREIFRIENEQTGETLDNPADRVLTTGATVHLANHTLLVDRTGIQRSIDDSAAPIRDQRGKLVGAVLVFRDITERRRSERRSTAQHAVTRVLAESPSLPEAAGQILTALCETLQFDFGVLWAYDAEAGTAKVLQVWRPENETSKRFEHVCRSYAFKRGEGLPGIVWESLAPLWVLDFSQDARFPRAAEAGRAGLRTAFAFPIAIEAEAFGALEFFSRECSPVDTDLLNVARGVGTQIAQFVRRKRAEDALAQSEELHRAISETAADGIVVIDEQSRILKVNDAVERIFGYSAAELTGESLKKLMPPRMHESHDRGMKRFLSTGEKGIPWTGVELPGLHKDGREIPLEISFGMARKGTSYLFIGLMRDITERKATEQAIQELNQELEMRVERRTAALQESNEQMEAFSYTVAHDLRAPLRAMQGFAHALLDDYGERLESTGADYLKRIMTSAHRMDTLIQDLLSYSQLSRADLSFKAVAVDDAIANALHGLEDDLREMKAEVQVTGSGMFVRAHAATLENVIANLVSNAIKFTRDGQAPRIQIGATEQGDAVRISVQDNGIGIAPEHHERIFRVFERLHGQNAFPGTGIGLAIVKKGIERMNGRVGLSSEPGKGTLFWIQLPRESRPLGS